MNGSVDAVITVTDQQDNLSEVLKSLRNQTVSYKNLIIAVRTGLLEEAALKELAVKYHARTILLDADYEGMFYNAGLKACTSDFVLFMDGSASPMRNDLTALLLEDMKEEHTAVSFGHLVSDFSAPTRSRAQQSFFYQEVSGNYSFRDIYKYGMRVFMHRNACALYRRSAFEKTGVFENVCLSRPEYLWCARALYQDLTIHYNADARVNYNLKRSLKAAFQDSFDCGVLQAMYPQILGMTVQMTRIYDDRPYPILNVSMGEIYEDQRDYAVTTARKYGAILPGPGLSFSCLLKKLGDRLGKYYHRLPLSFVRAFSSRREYWAVN